MNQIEKLCDLYGAPVTLQELCDSVLKFVNHKEVILFGWGFEVKYSDSVSNTHSCPKSGATNWHYHKDKPRSYPGWQGRIWTFWKKQKRDSSTRNSVFPNLGLFTGTGGYGTYSCPFEKDIDAIHSLQRCYPLSHHFRLYEDDWPSILDYKNSKMEQVLNPDFPIDRPILCKSIIRRSNERNITEENQS